MKPSSACQTCSDSMEAARGRLSLGVGRDSEAGPGDPRETEEKVVRFSSQYLFITILLLCAIDSLHECCSD